MPGAPAAKAAPPSSGGGGCVASSGASAVSGAAASGAAASCAAASAAAASAMRSSGAAGSGFGSQGGEAVAVWGASRCPLPAAAAPAAPAPGAALKGSAASSLRVRRAATPTEFSLWLLSPPQCSPQLCVAACVRSRQVMSAGVGRARLAPPQHARGNAQRAAAALVVAQQLRGAREPAVSAGCEDRRAGHDVPSCTPQRGTPSASRSARTCRCLSAHPRAARVSPRYATEQHSRLQLAARTSSVAQQTPCAATSGDALARRARAPRRTREHARRRPRRSVMMASQAGSPRKPRIRAAKSALDSCVRRA